MNKKFTAFTLIFLFALCFGKTYAQSSQYYNIIRLSGRDRFETNDIIVDEMNIKKGTPIFITNGFNFPDALSISSVAASKGYPIFMSENNTIPQSILNKISIISPSKIYIIGGIGALSQNIEKQLAQSLKSINYKDIIRINGKNRYDTSLKIADYFKSNSKHIILANGENFPDALSGSALASKLNAPILLTDGKNTSIQKDYIVSSNYDNIVILDGYSSISSNIEHSFNGIKLDTSGSFNNEEIVDLISLDINNDGKLENIILTQYTGGKTVIQAMFSDNFIKRLYIQDASNGNILDSKIIPPNKDMYTEIILGDMTGDKLPEIIAISEGLGTSVMQSCYIETISENKFVNINNFNDGENPDFQMLNERNEDIFSYELNGYETLKMYSKKFNKTFSVDVTPAMEYSKKHGQNVVAWIGHGPYYSIYNINNSNKYGLKVYWDICGAAHSNILAGVDCYYKYEDGIFKLTDLDFSSTLK